MATSEKFCLRWNDFETNISGAFREIRDEKDFFDCTLSCGSRQIQAHKLILSACSPFFRSVLKQNPHQHPLLYLKGVEFTDLQAVLSFMYHGEVNVAQEELNSFLAVAEDLQVKGLTQSNSNPIPPTKPNTKPAQTFTPTAPKPQTSKRKEEPLRQPQSLPQASQEQHYDEDIQEVLPMVKTEPEQVSYPNPIPGQALHGTEVASMDESYGETDTFDYGGYDGDQGYEGQYDQGVGGAELNKDSGSYMNIIYNEVGVKVYSCQICGKGFKKSSHVKTHIENVHAKDGQVQCGICTKMFKNRESLKTHFRIIHKLAKDQIY